MNVLYNSNPPFDSIYFTFVTSFEVCEPHHLQLPLTPCVVLAELITLYVFAVARWLLSLLGKNSCKHAH